VLLRSNIAITEEPLGTALLQYHCCCRRSIWELLYSLITDMVAKGPRSYHIVWVFDWCTPCALTLNGWLQEKRPAHCQGLPAFSCVHALWPPGSPLRHCIRHVGCAAASLCHLFRGFRIRARSDRSSSTVV